MYTEVQDTRGRGIALACLPKVWVWASGPATTLGIRCTPLPCEAWSLTPDLASQHHFLALEIHVLDLNLQFFRRLRRTEAVWVCEHHPLSANIRLTPG